MGLLKLRCATMGKPRKQQQQQQRGMKLHRLLLMRSCCRSKFYSPAAAQAQAQAQYVSQSPKQGSSEEEEENAGGGCSSEEAIRRGIQCLPDDLLLECLARVPRSSINAVMMVSCRFKSLMRSPSYYEVRSKAEKLENLLFVLGGAGTGLKSAVLCNSNGNGNGGWAWGAGLLFSPQSVRGDEWFLDYHGADNSLLYAQAAAVRHEIYILAAVPCPAAAAVSGHSSCTIVYDVWNKRLSRKAPMLFPRKKFACCVIADRIFVAGGALLNDSNKEAIVDAEFYIPELDQWRPIANMPRKRYGCLGAAVNGIFYVIGGLKFGNMNVLSVEPYAYVNSMDSFDTRTNSWLRTKSLPMGGCVISCAVVGCCIYMLSSHAVELSLWKYVTHTGSWMRMKAPPIPSPVRLDNVLKFSCVALGTSLYIVQVGGSIDDLLRRSRASAFNSMEGQGQGLVLIYDTKLQAWHRGPDLPYIQNGATSVVVHC